MISKILLTHKQCTKHRKPISNNQIQNLPIIESETKNPHLTPKTKPILKTHKLVSIHYIDNEPISEMKPKGSKSPLKQNQSTEH